MTRAHLSALLSALCITVLAACSDRTDTAQERDISDEQVTQETSPSGENSRVYDEPVRETENTSLTGDMEQDSAVMQQLLRQMRMQLGTASADHPEQCKLLPIGEKPCGGPERFLLYSEQGVRDEAQLIKLAEQYTDLSREFNRIHQMVSDCQVLVQPAVTVRDGVCMPIETAIY
ncbi:hypothetical protein [Aliidiomarina sanyensis]|uniref:Secreted protein n=1 Tax=Aliidiomarina sanyensis TaxID=1249555 RepID=A0A432WN73_9GAMM|nr:hypothetical protein [Aliidiomarina sanyensis]RUO35243.1 hypothetical protein CWE11_04205 [Aliidiomarina sanyensis]